MFDFGHIEALAWSVGVIVFCVGFFIGLFVWLSNIFNLPSLIEHYMIRILSDMEVEYDLLAKKLKDIVKEALREELSRIKRIETDEKEED